MIRNFFFFLRKISPFLAVIILWRLQLHWWNPAGILAIIPIFFFSFVRVVDWMPLFSILFCFLIDYNGDTKLFWTCCYLIAYAINGFQYFIDLHRADKNAIVPFVIFFGASCFILMFADLSWTTVGRALWLFVWVSVLYVPFTNLLTKVLPHD